MSDTTKTLEINGLDEIIRDISGAVGQADKYLRPAMTDSLNMLWDAVAKYPPESEANRPGRTTADGRPMGYYERGRGWWDPVMGTIRGKTGKARGIIRADESLLESGVTGYKLRNGGESELLGRSWTQNVFRQDDALIGEMGTTVSYADYVQGDRQRKFHAKRGWITLGMAFDIVKERIFRRFDAAVAQFVKEFGGRK